MIKNNKLKVTVSSIIILLPMLFGAIVWKDLPDLMAIHFGSKGADGFAGKGFVVFGIPVIFLALHFIALTTTFLDKRQKGQTKKALGIVFWIIPLVSAFLSIITYSIALNGEVNLSILIPSLLGALFILMGNYTPKIKQNGTLGIKVLWTLRNEENWNRTHRFGGKVMVGCGFVMLLSALFPIEVALVVSSAALVVCLIAVTLYSYFIYKQHQKQGIEYTAWPKSKGEKVILAISAVIVTVILIGISVIMFAGNIEVELGDVSLKISATFWTDIEVDYSEFDTVEYRKDFSVGIKTNGFNSARLLMGVFKNEEFGLYTIYAYRDAEEFIVLTSNEKTLVIGMKEAKDTQAIYDTLSKKLGE